MTAQTNRDGIFPDMPQLYPAGLREGSGTDITTK